MKILYIILLLALAGVCQAADMYSMKKPIEDIKSEYESQLMTMQGVVSVGLGMDVDGHTVIVIGVETEEHFQNLVLPQELHSYPVKFQVTGTIKAR